ncbi:coat F domain protein [Clostridium acetireducens DSM 10703]|uniref:Coat F domain protein n=1 Tax=Clostridium acetireducens DSM 10703 TaxID=1121290 RepID=A0A1E8EVJ3_9CLOT|nr:spore coat protein [Clostridium acetireducens]OFH99524.1 coat F domain protein [Clostridium acetireducens DSM 10703]
MSITLSQKERMLLEDQKSHEQLCIEKYSNYASQTNDAQLKQIFNANRQTEQEHLNSINQLLSGQIPQMNQQQGGQQQSVNAQATQNLANNMNQNAQPSGMENVSDKDMCSDLLMTEKYVSGTYDTAIFEFRDPNVRSVLNHIQKEEQEHGEAIYKYMESKGLYNIQ